MVLIMDVIRHSYFLRHLGDDIAIYHENLNEQKSSTHGFTDVISGQF
jgi:hypothetical protein